MKNLNLDLLDISGKQKEHVDLELLILLKRLELSDDLIPGAGNHGFTNYPARNPIFELPAFEPDPKINISVTINNN